MIDNLTTALEITVVGMALVFGAIILLWLVMIALVRLTADHAIAEIESASETELKRRAALAAVAVALAREQNETQPRPFPLPPDRDCHGMAGGPARALVKPKRSEKMKVTVKINDRSFEVEITDLYARPIVATVEGERFEVWPENGCPDACSQSPRPPPNRPAQRSARPAASYACRQRPRRTPRSSARRSPA